MFDYNSRMWRAVASVLCLTAACTATTGPTIAGRGNQPHDRQAPAQSVEAGQPAYAPGRAVGPSSPGPADAPPVETTVPYARRYAGTWTPSLPSLPLIALAPAAPRGRIWVREYGGGIAVEGDVAELPNHRGYYFAGRPVQAASRPYIALWLAGVRKDPLPPRGWGNQFGMTSCAAPGPNMWRPSAATCAAWNAQMDRYRSALRQLFFRRWRLAPQWRRERAASRAYRRVLDFVPDAELPVFKPLAPHGLPRWDEDGAAFQTPTAAQEPPHHVQFSFLVPWSAFPPLRRLTLGRIWLNVKVCASSRACAATAPRARPDRPATWDSLTLARPRTWHLTPCGAQLTGGNKLGIRFPGWFLPRSRSTVMRSFALVNVAAGYQYDPDSLSPTPVWTRHFVLTAGKHQFVCGPALRYRVGSKVYAGNARLDRGTAALRPLGNGTFLLRSGPSVTTGSPLGAGECGSCPLETMALYELDPRFGISRVLKLDLYVGGDMTDADIRISPDWHVVTAFTDYGPAAAKARGLPAGWSFTRYCFAGHAFSPCGTGAGGPPRGHKPLN